MNVARAPGPRPVETEPRSCDGCTMCCRLLGVAELSKPAGTQCSHCLPGKGCGVYAVRPQTCRDFQCLWLQGQIPLELKPNRSRVVFATSTDRERLVAYLAPGVSLDDETPVMAYIRHVASTGCEVIAAHGDFATLLRTNGTQETAAWDRWQGIPKPEPADAGA